MPTIYHDTEIQFFKGVGPKLAQVFHKKNIRTATDLLGWLPRTYEDRRRARNIASLMPGELVSLVASVVKVNSIPMGKSYRKMYEVILADESGRLSCKYFRVPYKGYFNRFLPHMKVRVSGKVGEYRGRIQMQHPEIHPYQEDEKEADKVIPLYSEIDGIKQGKLRSLLQQAIYHVIENPPELTDYDLEMKRHRGVPEYIPQWICDKYQLISRSQSLRHLHKPNESQYSVSDFLDFKTKAHERIIFEEFFWLELHLALKKQGIQKQTAIAIEDKNNLVQKVIASLPFELTNAQVQAIADIKKDLAISVPMHRMVQGDVGCGKTLVGLLSCLHVIENGYQAAFMAPTEILAEQHYKNAEKLLQPHGIKVGLLVGSMRDKEKQEMYRQLATGEVHLCIGTHALIQEKVEFKSLCLSIIDEQHRFGVEQRSQLMKKSISPHFLVMTATPIPRSLAMTVYGDLDVSIIDEKPAGRTPIITRKAFESKRTKVFGFVIDQLKKGRQAYIVYPLVEESEKMNLKNAIDEHARLCKEFPQYKFGLLHGKMKAAEKDDIMRRFRDGELHVLVATTVIEVGVDVPNANIMVIEHTERFGLSQLHQLRGRVGRGEHKSYCVLMLGYSSSDLSRERAEIMESTDDGFKIAEKDLEIRGPGEFLGRRQSGLPGFQVANLVRDQKILNMAKEAAFDLIAKDPQLKSPDHQKLVKIIEKTNEITVG